MQTQAKKTETTAQKIAALLGDDGQNFETADGRTLDQLAKAEGGEPSFKSKGISGEPMRYDFRDGSSIVTAGPMWDLGVADAPARDCYCCAGANGGRHDDTCEAEAES